MVMAFQMVRRLPPGQILILKESKPIGAGESPVGLEVDTRDEEPEKPENPENQSLNLTPKTKRPPT